MTQGRVETTGLDNVGGGVNARGCIFKQLAQGKAPFLRIVSPMHDMPRQIGEGRHSYHQVLHQLVASMVLRIGARACPGIAHEFKVADVDPTA